MVISTDNSKRIIEENQEFINQCISEPDKGIYDAMNKGIRMVKGKWVYFWVLMMCFTTIMY
jgi:glycosyltransferase involved in cell wall biosynthesis